MFLENGTLPMGVLYDGILRREFTLRPLKVKDSRDARKSPDFARCKDDDELMGLLAYASRLEIKGIPRKAMTLDLMLDMYDDDLDEVLKVDGRLKEEIARFRGEDTQAIDIGTGQDRDTMGAGQSDAARGGLGMDRSLAGFKSTEDDVKDLQG